MNTLPQNYRVDAKPYLTKDTPPGSEMSWFGRAWRNSAIAVYNNASSILGGMGGPLGSILASLIEAGVNVVLQRGTYIEVDAQVFDGLTSSETKMLHSWLRNVLAPTIKAIVEGFDIHININTGNRGNSETVVSKINEALNKIYHIQAYGTAIKEAGEKGAINGYTRQKAELILKIVEYVEKALIIYAEQNLEAYKLVGESVIISENIQIETLALNYQNTSIKQVFKSYVPTALPTSDNQTEIPVTDTNSNSDAPATQTGTSEVVSSKSKGKKIVLIIGTVALATLILRSTNKK